MDSIIRTIDVNYLGMRQAIASYIILGPEGPVMIETGPASSIDGLISGLAELGLKPSDIKHTLVTHIHFDHAGAAGWMAQQGSKVYVHELGYPHLLDPSKLMKSARRIYGDDMDRLWGELLPIPAEQLVAVKDRDVLHVGGVEITALDTPGHAKHHLAFAMEDGWDKVCFTGDIAATFMEESTFLSIPMPPPEFDLGAWRTSIDKLFDERFFTLYPTHFGRIDTPVVHLTRVKYHVRHHAEYIRDLMEQGLSQEEIRPRYLEWVLEESRRCHVPEDKLGFYVKDSMADMNVTGVCRYWSQQAQQTTT